MLASDEHLGDMEELQSRTASWVKSFMLKPAEILNVPGKRPLQFSPSN